MLVFLFSLCFLAHAGLLAAALYSLVVIADLESDFVNPHDCAASLNKWLVSGAFDEMAVMGISRFRLVFPSPRPPSSPLSLSFSHSLPPSPHLLPPARANHATDAGPRVRHPVGHGGPPPPLQGLDPGPRPRRALPQAVEGVPGGRRDRRRHRGLQAGARREAEARVEARGLPGLFRVRHLQAGRGGRVEPADAGGEGRGAQAAGGGGGGAARLREKNVFVFPACLGVWSVRLSFSQREREKDM